MAKISRYEALQRMESLKLDDENLSVLLKELMHVENMRQLPPAHVEHYRQAAAAAALLVAMKTTGDVADFVPAQLVAGTPAMAFRLAFAKRLAAMHGVNIL